jgi:hypothetical protein
MSMRVNASNRSIRALCVQGGSVDVSVYNTLELTHVCDNCNFASNAGGDKHEIVARLLSNSDNRETDVENNS